MTWDRVCLLLEELCTFGVPPLTSGDESGLRGRRVPDRGNRTPDISTCRNPCGYCVLFKLSTNLSI